MPSQNCILSRSISHGRMDISIRPRVIRTRDKINSPCKKNTIFVSACPAFRLVGGGKSNARRSNGHGNLRPIRGLAATVTDSPDWLETATCWNFRRLSATATGSWENTRWLGNFYASPSRTEKVPYERISYDRMGRRESMKRLWLNAVWSVCHSRFEWIAPLSPRGKHEVWKPFYYTLKMRSSEWRFYGDHRASFSLWYDFFLLFFFFPPYEKLPRLAQRIDTVERFITCVNMQLKHWRGYKNSRATGVSDLQYVC